MVSMPIAEIFDPLKYVQAGLNIIRILDFKVLMESVFYSDAYVVVQFYPWFKFYFLLVLGIAMYDNEL